MSQNMLGGFNSELPANFRGGRMTELVGMPAGDDPLIIPDDLTALFPRVRCIRSASNCASVRIHREDISRLSLWISTSVATRNIPVTKRSSAAFIAALAHFRH